MDVILLTLTVCIILGYLCYLLTINKKNLNDYPSPPGLIFFGHIFELRSTTTILHKFMQFVSDYGPIVRMKVTPLFDVLLITDYELSKFFLTKTKKLTKSENYLYLKPWLGNGLLISEGVEWKKTRKILTPAFHFEILKHFVRVFESVGSVLIDKLHNCSDPDDVDLFPFIKLCTLDAICETAMSVKINGQDGENSNYVNSVDEMSRIIINRSLSVLKLKDFTFPLTSDYYVQRKLLKTLHGFTLGVIADKKSKLNVSNCDENKKLGLLNLLQNYQDENGLKLSDEKIREEVDTFMFEGHDTTASAICFTLFCLANHPQIQKTVLNEQYSLFGEEKNPKITYDDLQNMSYLENVIKESLRLYPPVPIIGRYVTEDMKFENHFIPKKTNIVLFIYGLHRNPDYFPEPERFNPDRFNRIDGSQPYAHIPFSAGERNCIGQKFALLELKSIISKTVRHFELKPAVPQHDIILSVEMVLKSKNGVRVGLKRRE